MKKTNLLIITLLLVISLTISITAVTDVGDVSQVLGEQFNISADKIPTDPEKIKQLYLQTQWTEFIAKSRVLGPAHAFLTKISIAFQILFAHPYEISLTLFAIIVLWFIFGTQASKIIEAKTKIKGAYAFIIGLLIAIILAQARVIKVIATFLLDLIFKPSNWWMRIIVIIIVLAVVAIEIKESQILAKRLKENKIKKTQEEAEQQLKEVKGLTKGVQKFK
ncbi:MAG: hypothetical protein KJ718_00445 [Nanoarchaeota archaeon]|nr:hypothetical protein [Nanoarchaeota archaeon]MBU1051010.1 hypothetical protein [Nanoarchaeota archaeon]MBU1989051.1 hypothetical protein [Nanoarchaeota archaeon]